MTAPSRTCTIDSPSGPVEFPVSTSPGGKFEGIDGRNIHSFLGIQTRLSSWAPGSALRLSLRVGKDFIKFTEKRDGLAGRGTTTYLFSQKAAQQILETSRPKSSPDKQALVVVPRQSDVDLEKQIEAALPLLETLFGDETDLSVNARDLHAALAVRKDFTDWIKNQLKRGRWVEGRDFAALHFQGENPMGGRPSAEYALSLTVAKHITVMSHCRLGYAVREYVFRAEKEFRKKMYEARQELEVSGYPVVEVRRHPLSAAPEKLARLKELLASIRTPDQQHLNVLRHFVLDSLLVYFGAERLDQLGERAEYCRFSHLLKLCVECFRFNNFDPTWWDDGLLAFPVDAGTRIVRHPRMLDFHRRDYNRAPIADIQRYNDEQRALRAIPLDPPQTSSMMPGPDRIFTSMIKSKGLDISFRLQPGGEPHIILAVDYKDLPKLAKTMTSVVSSNFDKRS